MKVSDVKCMTDALAQHDASTVIHGWDANGSPVTERVVYLDIDEASPLAQMIREERECEHAWEPLRGWNGRYRCARCGVLAYRKIVLGCNTGRDSLFKEPHIVRGAVEQMVVYLCQRKGCRKGAVTRRGGASQFCAEHKGRKS